MVVNGQTLPSKAAAASGGAGGAGKTPEERKTQVRQCKFYHLEIFNRDCQRRKACLTPSSLKIGERSGDIIHNSSAA